MFALVILALSALFLFYIYQTSSSSSKAPPGPKPYPIIGNLPHLSRAGPTPYEALASLAKKYGDVMSIRLGLHKVVVLSSYTAMKDLLTRDELSGRYIWPFSTDRSFHSKELGVVFTSNKFWNDTRKTTIKTLRDFGFGKKSSMEVVIREEVSDILAYIRTGLEKTDGVLGVLHNFDLSVVNVLWSLVAGFRFKYDDPVSNQMMRYNDKINEAFNFNNVYLPFPILRKVFPKLTGWDKHMEYYKEVQDFMRGLIHKIRDQMMANNNDEGVDYQPQNFVEVYLMEIEKNKENPAQDNIYTEENLIMILLDLFLAGSETTNSVLRFSLLYMLHFQPVQDRCRQEINALSPSGEMLSIHDLHNLPYTKATLYEVFRYSNMVPIPLAHRTLKDVEYRGMVIKKDTCVMYNQTCNFFDESHFKDPHTFNPERFLSEDGTQVINTERVTAFGFGKRACLGENLAWNSFFIYFTTILQNYYLQLVPGEESKVDDVIVSFSLSPKEFKVKMVPVA